jgi:hypothetical protein
MTKSSSEFCHLRIPFKIFSIQNRGQKLQTFIGCHRNITIYKPPPGERIFRVALRSSSIYFILFGEKKYDISFIKGHLHGWCKKINKFYHH